MRLEWIEDILRAPAHREVQADRRIRFIDIDQASRHLDLTGLRTGSVPVELADRRV
jgi:hypothetical protein